MTLREVVLQDVELRRVGKEWTGCCPFHPEKTPSFSLNEEKGLYFCFGCGAKGDLVTYLMERRGYAMREALRLAGKDLAPYDRAHEDRKRHAREAVLAQFFCWKREQFRALDELVRELYIAEVAYRCLCRRPDLWTDAEASWWETYLGDLYFHWERMVYETDQLLDDHTAWMWWLKSKEDAHE